jgi:hypothetical protein
MWLDVYQESVYRAYSHVMTICLHFLVFLGSGYVQVGHSFVTSLRTLYKDMAGVV